MDIGTGVRWLRETQGVEHVVLLGNSGGGSLMAAYQSHAVSPNVVPLAGMRPRGRPGRPGARGRVHRAGRAPGAARRAHRLAGCGGHRRAGRDRYRSGPGPVESANGPPYSPEFVQRYRAAQVARNQRITDWAKAELARLSAAGLGDRLFTLARTWADPRMVDPAIDPEQPQAELVLPGRPAPGQPVDVGHRRVVHAAHVAVDVEPGDVPVPGRAAPGQRARAGAGR